MKQDYDSIIRYVIKLEKNKNIKFLSTISCFEKWATIKLKHFLLTVGTRIYMPGQTVYKVGDHAGCVYIVKSGTLSEECVIELYPSNRYPKGSHSWTRQYKKRKVIYKAKELNSKDVFGHHEMFKNKPREFQVVSKTESRILFIGGEEFKKYFNKKDEVLALLKQFPQLEIDEINERIAYNDQMKRARQKAFLDGIGFNCVPESNRIFSEIDKKSIKLRPWLTAAKRIHNIDPNVLETRIPKPKKTLNADL